MPLVRSAVHNIHRVLLHQGGRSDKILVDRPIHPGSKWSGVCVHIYALVDPTVHRGTTLLAQHHGDRAKSLLLARISTSKKESLASTRVLLLRLRGEVASIPDQGGWHGLR